MIPEDGGVTSQPSSSNSTFGNESETTTTAASMPVDVATAVIYTIVFVVGLMGNMLVIYVVIRYTKMKTVTNIYILNLALADEIYILGIPFLFTNNVLSYWPYGDFFCKVCMTADTMSQFASTFCLTVMSIDRYLAVVHPIRSTRWRKPQVAKVLSSMMWVVSFLVVLPVTIYSNVQKDPDTCNVIWPEPNKLWSIAFILYTAILGFFGPLVVISLCYLLIVIKVRSAGVRAGRTKRRKSERKVTRMVVVIVLVFVICWLPFFTTNTVNLIHPIPGNETTMTVYFFLVILTYVNSCANPILYGFLSENFKQSFQKVLCVLKSNSVSMTNKIRDREELRQGNHHPIYSAENHAQNGTPQQIHLEVTGDPVSEFLTAETVVNNQTPK